MTSQRSQIPNPKHTTCCHHVEHFIQYRFDPRMSLETLWGSDLEGQRTHFTAKFIITTLLSPLGCTSLWQSWEISLSEGLGWSEMVDLVVAGLGARSEVLLCRRERGRRAAKGKKQMERRKKNKNKNKPKLRVWGLDQCKQRKYWLRHLPPTGSSAARELRAGCKMSFLSWCGANPGATAGPEQTH